MLNIFQLFKKPLDLKKIPLKPYLIGFSLDRLVFGVDNIHFDVHISPQLYNALKKAASLVIIKNSRSDYFFKDYKREYCEREKDTLKHICTEVLLDGINRAKAEAELQIDYLGQAALAKMFLEEVKVQYKNVVGRLELLLRTFQLSQKHAEVETFKTKEKLFEIKLHKNRIIRLAGEELFQVLTDIHAHQLRNMRETHFKSGQILPDIFFNNPVLHTNNPADDFFLIEEYVLLGQRSEDQDNYNNFKSIIYNLLDKADLGQRDTQEESNTSEEKNNDVKHQNALNVAENNFDIWLMETGNIDRMFNFFDSQEQLDKARSAGSSSDMLYEIKEQKKIQQKLLSLFYRKFNKSGLLKQIVAAFEMKKIYANYCPPIAPRQIREYLTDFWSRNSLTRQLNRRRSLQGKAFPLAPLKETISLIRGSSASEKKWHLISFLRQFSRYHRDLNNARILQEAMESINLVTEEKTIQLSRENRSLFEYLLSSERVKEEKQVSNHVIIKADIRGSMNINHEMRNRTLNPASHFSLNFFDPISEILPDYAAAKVFIEGDAIILSLFEHEDTPQGWYCVARACGLAIRIQQIVHRLNVKNQENNLPILESGIGICYSQGPPTYLFDGDSKIMISPSINLADRLSSSSKKLREYLKDQKTMHNLYVFKNVEEKNEETADDFFLRYNVNGIELSDDGFAKLTREIKLKAYSYKMSNGEIIQLYSGKVPTVSGNYQQLAIREAIIYEVKPENFDITGETSKKYYEVCTDQKIYDFIDKHI